ncbi:hypothetical protein KAS08_01240 [Candidatus Pacearchaeota archaeon]|nr:hypothetical protein [Candidatus Pacearchaeota archaeon]
MLFGTNKKCSVKEYEKITYPEDKTPIIKMLKQKYLWDEFSMINYSRFTSKIKKKEMDEDLISLIKKEKAFRLTLSKISQESSESPPKFYKQFN